MRVLQLLFPHRVWGRARLKFQQSGNKAKRRPSEQNEHTSMTQESLIEADRQCLDCDVTVLDSTIASLSALCEAAVH